MNSNQIDILSLSICIILLIILFCINLKIKRKKQMYKVFIFIILCLMICCIGQLFSLIFGIKYNIPAIYFDYFVYIGTCLLPVAFLFLGLVLFKTEIKFSKYLYLFIIPIISLLVLWTNEYHHLFYVQYSTNTIDTIFGPYFYVHTVYTFALLGFGIYFLLRYSFKNSGFFSKQSLLIILGASVPLVLNLLGIFGIPMSIYLTPISFTITVLAFMLAIFKFGFMRIAPIALQQIVDRISDGYIVLDENNIITDFNNAFLKMFNLIANYVRGQNVFTLIKEKPYFPINADTLISTIEQVKNTNDTLRFEKKLSNVEKYFNIEINSINNNKTFLGILILFKDTTQHMLDMQTIQNNQNMLMERERLASLGQLIGGIAHNLKTPIMSISGAAEGLSDLVKEYETSVGDPEVTIQDHHDIAKDMKEWIEKTRSYTEYMSDIITAVKGQTVTMSEEQAVTFTLDELVKRVNILMRHELKNALVSLNVSMKADERTELKGNINSLVQVINNMISNAIQAYDGEPNKEIDLILEKNKQNIVISVQDYGKGLPEEVQKKLFKEMITTKGKNGTGLGLFMSYSTIRAHFNGNITFETKKGKGTEFHVVLPL